MSLHSPNYLGDSNGTQRTGLAAVQAIELQMFKTQLEDDYRYKS